MYTILCFNASHAEMEEKSPRPQDQVDRKIPHRRLDKEKIHQMYQFGKKLGQGMFGVVCEAVNIATGQLWAIKIINKEKAFHFHLVIVIELEKHFKIASSCYVQKPSLNSI